MRIDKIKIFPCFEAHAPLEKKLECKDRYYQEHGEFESQIVLDAAGNLIDGYTTYLLAKKYGLEHVPVRYGQRQIIMAAHRPGGKLYTWELPGILIGRVRAGDRVVVRAAKGCTAVKVAEVEEYAGQEPEPHKMVLWKWKGRSDHG
jgi:hypothetical protein